MHTIFKRNGNNTLRHSLILFDLSNKECPRFSVTGTVAFKMNCPLFPSVSYFWEYSSVLKRSLDKHTSGVIQNVLTEKFNFALESRLDESCETVLGKIIVWKTKSSNKKIGKPNGLPARSPSLTQVSCVPFVCQQNPRCSVRECLSKTLLKSPSRIPIKYSELFHTKQFVLISVYIRGFQ